MNISPLKEEPTFRKVNIENLKSNYFKHNLRLKFFTDQTNENQKYRGRNFKGALSNGLSNIIIQSSRDKPIGILNTYSSSQSLTITDLKSNTSRRNSYSFYYKRNNDSINLDKRTKTFKLATNTFVSTSETDNKPQDTIDNISGDKNLRKMFKSQLSKISEDPNKKNSNELTIDSYYDLKDNKRNINIEKIIYNVNNKRSRNSLFINNAFTNKTMRQRILSGRKINHFRTLTKQLTNNNGLLFTRKKSILSDNSPRDYPNNNKKLRLKEICKNLIEKNQLKLKEIQKKKMKYLSHFEIENDKKEIINRKENQLIDKYIIDINNEVKNNLNNYIKEIEKLDIKKVKEEILISSKVLKREMMILKYIYKKIKKKDYMIKLPKLILLFDYALELSEKYFPLILQPKTISLKLENEPPTDLITNFTLIDLRRPSNHLNNIFRTRTLIERNLTKKYTTFNVIKITLKSLQFINLFKLIDFHNAGNKNSIIFKQEKRKSFKPLFIPFKENKKGGKRKTMFRNSKIKFEFLYGNKLNTENISPKANKLSYDKPLFPKKFYQRTHFKKLIKKRKISEEIINNSFSKKKTHQKNSFSDIQISNKEHTLLRTREIKSIIESKLKDELEKLIYSIKDLNFPLFKRIYEQYSIGPNLNDEKGNSLLSLAVQSNCFQIVNFLLNSGADPNISNVRLLFI